MQIQMIAFDVAGTTVKDDGIVIRAFAKAFSRVVPQLWELKSNEFTEYAIETMGQSKIEVFTALLEDVELAKQAAVDFEDAYLELVQDEGVAEMPGASELFLALRTAGISTALTTGFSRPTLDAILGRLGWDDLVDFTVTPAEVGLGRPSPLMLQRAAAELGVSHPAACVVVGDTQSDMEAALAFGAGEVVGVLSGAHNRETLAGAGATSVVNSVANLKAALFPQGL